MFGLFGAKCPVPDHVRDWVEERTKWLSARGKAMPQGRMLTPDPSDLGISDPENLSECYYEIYERLARHVGVDPAEVPMAFFEAARISDISPLFEGRERTEAGVYGVVDGKPGIWIEDRAADIPAAFLGTVSHELAHAVLLGRGLVTGDEEDHEELTDLATVHLGLGVFTANSVLFETSWLSGGWEGWSAQKFGYLNGDTFAYALAVRGEGELEDRQRWSSHLGTEVRKTFERASRYLSSRSGTRRR